MLKWPSKFLSWEKDLESAMETRRAETRRGSVRKHDSAALERSGRETPIVFPDLRWMGSLNEMYQESTGSLLELTGGAVAVE